MIECNPAACRLYGYCREEMLSMAVADLIPEGMVRTFATEVAEGSAFAPIQGKRKNGALFTGEARISRIAQAGRGYIMWQVRDISSRLRANEQLHLILAGMRGMVWQARVRHLGGDAMDWQISVPNEAAAQQFLPLQMLPGQSYLQAFYQNRLPEERQKMDQVSREALLDGKSGYSQEFLCLRADGVLRWIYEDVRIEPQEPGCWRLTGLCTDVTERKQAETEREELVLQLQEAISQVKILRGLLPICASCKRIKDEADRWRPIESYIRDHSEAEFSHGIGPECAQKLYPEIFRNSP
ncbi:MAG: PAS domain S-box protein [Armatimonadetes bacterium]|nr:PAS domain S-box protein [Armatimonadota bacterium]